MKLLPIALLVVLFCPAAGQPSLRDILRAQDLRDVALLTVFLRDSDSTVRMHAAFAAGSVQDTASIASLIRLLTDPSASVRAAAAFALGQVNYTIDSVRRGEVSNVLLTRSALEHDRAVVRRLVEALGKVGDRESLRQLVRLRAGWKEHPLAGEVALSIGRYGYRGIAGASAVEFSVRVLDGVDSAEAWKGAYALMRVGEGSLLSPYTTRIVGAVHHSDARVRMHIATVLGKLQDATAAIPPLVAVIQRDADWRVRVNAIKALSRFDPNVYDEVVGTVLQATDDLHEHVSLTALVAVGSLNLRREELRDRVLSVLKGIIEAPSTSSGRKREAVLALARSGRSEVFSYLKKLHGEGMVVRDVYVEALGQVGAGQALDELLGYAQTPDPRLQRTVLESVVACIKLAGDTSLAVAGRSVLTEALGSTDMAVLTTAAHGLADSMFAAPDAVKPLERVLQRLRSPEDVEPMVEIIRTLGALRATEAIATLRTAMNDSDRTVALEAAAVLEQLTGRPHKQFVAAHTVPRYTDFDWEFLDWVREHRVVGVKTNKGSFTFVMLPDEAPFTCMNFARLIRKRMFDGLTFHRVVPNFVIQGGDPRGDGWGGPGYAIRSEFGFAHYWRGSVGVASAGKDTEGCQFFVTHSELPHLDGRYTLFGTVVSGMDVVDAIQVGDRIESITVIE